MSGTVLILNGPGFTDPASQRAVSDQSLTLQAIQASCASLAAELGMQLDFRQTDDANELAQWLCADCDGLIVSPFGISKTTGRLSKQYYAALRSARDGDSGKPEKPIIELYLDNIFRPADDNDRYVYSAVPGVGLICGLGQFGYLLALRAVARDLA
jgi:3-dehydroquinate dehydratase-2